MEQKEKLDLSQFSGTFHYYKCSAFGSLKVTDGVHWLRAKAECFWFTDIIASYQHELEGEEFQVWKLKVNEDESAVVTCEDGNGNRLKKQKLQYTDFKKQSGLDEVEVWVENEVVYLPSER